MSNDANNTGVAPVPSSSRVENTLQAVDTGASEETQVVDIKIDCEVPSSWVAERDTHHADTSDARRFRAIFSDGAKLFMFHRRNVRRDMNIGAWRQRSSLLWRWGPSTLKNVFMIDMPVERHAQEVNYLHLLIRL